MSLCVVEVFEGEVGHLEPVLVRELVARGLRVRVVCPPRAAASFAGTGAAVTPLAVGSGVASLAVLRRLLRGVTDEENGGPDEVPDVVHAHGLRAGLAATVARTGGTPVVLSWWDPVPTTGPVGLVGRAVTRAVIPAAAAVLAVTPELAEAAHRLGAHEVSVTPPMLPAPLEPTRSQELVREELALPAQGPIVLARARLEEESRLQVLVEAGARWRRAGGPLVVLVGVGPAYRDLVARATVARAPVTFAGERTDPAPANTDRTDAVSDRTDIDPDDRASLADLLTAASLAVVTDPRARPEFALRAVRAGLPLVVPEGGLLAQLLGVGVRSVPPGDAEALQAAVRELLDDPAAGADLAAAARARVADWPGPAGVAGELATLYGRVRLLTPITDTPGGLQ